MCVGQEDMDLGDILQVLVIFNEGINMIVISNEGILNPKVTHILSGKNRQVLNEEMIKTVNELYWENSKESHVLTSFINEFFDQYSVENVNKQEYTDEEVEQWRQKISNEECINMSAQYCKCGYLPIVCRCK